MRPVKPRVIEFEIYRPEPPSGKLENLYHQPEPSSWAPTISYKKKLHEVATQLTPAEAYRERVQQTRQETRILQKLEQRWNHHLVLWTKSTTKVQACFRGWVKRKAFNEQKAVLKLQAEQRVGYKQGLERYHDGDPDAGLAIIDHVSVTTVKLLVLKARMLYCTNRFVECVEVCKKITGNHTIRDCG
jgi:hypothetical protein